MGFKCGLVGLPNAGKSTIFNAITNLGVEASAYPFCTIDPHFGVVPLEDERLDIIRQKAGSDKKTPTVLEFVDIAGLVQGASHGEGLGNRFLSHISRVDAVAYVIRCFEDDNVSHPCRTIDPVRDARIVSTELISKDTETVEKRLSKSLTAARSGDPAMKKIVSALEPLLSHLQDEKEIRFYHVISESQTELIREMNLLTAKPAIYIANVDEKHVRNSALVHQLQNHASTLQTPCISFCGQVQAEIAELEEPDRLAFMQAMGLDETGLQKLVRTGYQVLNLITFFTANEKEAHAWTVPDGTLIQQAAARVHTDFEKGFIRAEVISFSDLQICGSIRELHDHGLIAVQGRGYVVRDGDLVYFRV